MKRIIVLIILMGLFFAAFCAAQTQASGAVTFRQEGIASWYGPEFDGRPTASGEIFDSTQFTAAHRTLPFGTILTVTNTHNNRQVKVRVNDRGPFVSPRIIDLSRAAAETLDILSTGTAPVVVESITNIGTVGPVYPSPPPVAPPAVISSPETGTVLSAPIAPIVIPDASPPVLITVPATDLAAVPSMVPADPPVIASTVPETPVMEIQPPAVPQSAASPAPASAVPPRKSSGSAAIIGGIPPAGTGKHYRLQIGSYRIPRNAVEAFEKLKKAGLSPAYERNDDLYRVVLTGLRPEDIESIAEKLSAAGFQDAVIREER